MHLHAKCSFGDNSSGDKLANNIYYYVFVEKMNVSSLFVGKERDESSNQFIQEF